MRRATLVTIATLILFAVPAGIYTVALQASVIERGLPICCPNGGHIITAVEPIGGISAITCEGGDANESEPVPAGTQARQTSRDVGASRQVTGAPGAPVSGGSGLTCTEPDAVSLCDDGHGGTVYCAEIGQPEGTPGGSDSGCAATTVGQRTIGCGQIAFQGKGPEKWASEYRKLALRYLAAERKLVELRQMVPYRRAVPYAVRLASVVYGVPERQLNTVMQCESGGWPLARNPSSTASGLMQFLDSTWSGSWGAKKFADAGFSVFDPIANMLAAAYVVSRDGSFRQWACAP